MRVLIVGLGAIALGLVHHLFRDAKCQVTGTDADPERLKALERAYRLITPVRQVWHQISTVPMNEVRDEYDLIVTCVGRKHLEQVHDWYLANNLSAPVMMAENLPGLVPEMFAKQIPIVVDRICPRVAPDEAVKSHLAVTAEDYWRVVTLEHPLTQALASQNQVTLLKEEHEVQAARLMKIFTVNTAHVVTAYFGQKLGAEFIEDAICLPQVDDKVREVIAEVGPWLGYSHRERKPIIDSLIARFSAPLKDPVAMIIGEGKKGSAINYMAIPFEHLKIRGFEAPVIEEVMTGLDDSSF